MLRLATNEEVQNWDALLAQNPDGGHIYQTKEWGDFKAHYNWRTLRLMFEGEAVRVAAQIMSKKAVGIGNIYYCSKGPGFFAGGQVDERGRKTFEVFSREVTEFIVSRDPRAAILKIEPEILAGQIDLTKFGYKKSNSDLSFKATIIVDINKPEEELLASFKQKTRYNINLARRKGVVIERRAMNQGSVDLMYDLMVATQKRAGFFLRKKSNFGRYWQALAEAKLGQFFVATHEGDVLAGIYVTRFNRRAYYKDGGSFETKRNLMAAYLIQWQAMLWAREHGATEYDMVAVPPPDQLIPEHPHYGLYQFKSGFNEHITEFVGAYDIELNAQLAKRWASGERYYHSIYHRITQNLFW